MSITRRSFLKTGIVAGGWALSRKLGIALDNAGRGRAASAALQMGQVPTPHDATVGLWHWKGEAIGESDLDELVATLKENCPRVQAVFVKTSDGAVWQGTFDTKTSMAIKGPQDVDRWVQALEPYAIGFHGWCVVKGVDLEAEADPIVQTCLVPGVRSMIIDVEPFDGYWEGSPSDVEELMERVRAGLPDGFHVGMAMDPREVHYEAISPDAWRPYIESLHPYVYWEQMGRTPIDILTETYGVWGDYGLPIYPVFQGNGTLASMSEAYTSAVQEYAAVGMSWHRLGIIGPDQLSIINESATLVERSYVLNRE